MTRILPCVIAVFVLGACEHKKTRETDPMPTATISVGKAPYGALADGTPIDQYTIANNAGVRVSIITWGGIVTNIETPDRSGRVDRIVLGFDSLDPYLERHPYFGCIAGRYCNRIAKGKFTLDGQEYTLATNNAPHHLHGGENGFDRQVWKAMIVRKEGAAGVAFSRLSKDGEEGYPGNVHVTCTYLLNDRNELRIDYEAITDKATHVNLTHHSYWNLAGPGGTVLDHVLRLYATQYTPADDTLITTGKIDPVATTPLDFTTPTAIGARIMNVPGGYDHNWVADGEVGVLRPHAELIDPKSGRVLEVASTEPGIQFYSGNFLDGVKGANRQTYDKHGGCCLEPQHYPDSPNKPGFPSTTLRPGERYRSTTVYRFTTR